jgi:DNA-directed RNA polymerase specialized sigma24 family protein
MKAHRKIIKEMLSSLGHEDTKMFNEVFIKGRTQTEVGKEMGLKRSTFGYRFQRLKRRLEKFKPEGF